MLAIIPLLLTTIFGLVFTFILTDKHLNKLERVAIGFLLGTGLQTYVIFILQLLGVRIDLINLTIQLVFLIFISFFSVFFLKRQQGVRDFLKSALGLKVFWESLTSSNILFKLFIILELILLITSLIIGLYWPVYGWDALALYDYRAISFVATGSFAESIKHNVLFGYPLYSSITHAWIYFFKGNPHMLYWSLYLAFIVITLFNILILSNTKIALLATSLISLSLPLFQGSWFDYLNMPYAVYLVTGMIYLIRWYLEKKTSFLFIGMLLTGLSTWIRSVEPFWMTPFVFIFLVIVLRYKTIRKEAVLRIIFAIALFFLIQYPWTRIEFLYTASDRTTVSLISKNTSPLANGLNFNQIGEVVTGTWQHSVSYWQPFFYIGLVFPLIFRKNLKRYWPFGFFLMTNIGLLFFGTYLFSLMHDYWKLILPSQQRMAAFIVPMLIIWVCLLSNDEK